MMTDLILAVLHHFAMLGVVTILAIQLTLVRPDMRARQLMSIVATDRVYGPVALALLAIGFSRVFFGLKGPDFYLGNHVFWTKVALFILMGLFSIRPTMRFLAWSRAAKTDASFLPEAGDVKNVRRFLHLQAAVLILIPIMAAMLGRNLG